MFPCPLKDNPARRERIFLLSDKKIFFVDQKINRGGTMDDSQGTLRMTWLSASVPPPSSSSPPKVMAWPPHDFDEKVTTDLYLEETAAARHQDGARAHMAELNHARAETA